MARIRTIKPDFWRHETLCALPEATHMLAAALLNYADDHGYFNANPRLIQGEIYPLREPSVSVADSLQALADAGYLALGTGDDGRRYGRVLGFAQHQRVSHPTPSKISERVIAWSGKAPETLRPEGKGKEEEGTLSAAADGDGEFEEFWTAYDPPKAARKPDARRAWAATAGIRPPQTELLRAVASYRAWVAGQSAAQKRDYPMQHPATWLRGEVWNGFVERAAADDADARAAWDGQAGPLVDEIGAAVFAAWFAGTSFEQGPPARITVPGEFRRKWIADHFGAALARCYGDCAVAVGP